MKRLDPGWSVDKWIDSVENNLEALSLAVFRIERQLDQLDRDMEDVQNTLHDYLQEDGLSQIFNYGGTDE